MGEIVRKKDAVDDILDDVRTTHANAVARGGIWQSVGYFFPSFLILCLFITRLLLPRFKKRLS